MTGDALPFLGYLLGIAVGFAILFGVVRLAVRYGLRDHHEWVEEQKTAPAKSEDSTGAA